MFWISIIGTVLFIYKTRRKKTYTHFMTIHVFPFLLRYLTPYVLISLRIWSLHFKWIWLNLSYHRKIIISQLYNIHKEKKQDFGSYFLCGRVLNKNNRIKKFYEFLISFSCSYIFFVTIFLTFDLFVTYSIGSVLHEQNYILRE